MEIKVGDKVQLISGGPVMAVTYKRQLSDDFNCAWFTADGIAHFAQFPPEVLTISIKYMGT